MWAISPPAALLRSHISLFPSTGPVWRPRCETVTTSGGKREFNCLFQTSRMTKELRICCFEDHTFPSLKYLKADLSQVVSSEIDDVEDDDDPSRGAWLVDEVTTPFNHISVIELGPEADHEYAGAFVLKLDDRDLVHSVYWHDRRVWTDSYYDEFALLPPLLPPGPIGILGLGAGTVARLLLRVFPSRQYDGWELDPEVVRVGRAYFGLADLEIINESGDSRAIRLEPGRSHRTFSRRGLSIHVGDALIEDSASHGRFAGLVVDLYSQGRICEGLKDSSVWAILKRRLQPGGRVMVNCGGPPLEGERDEEAEALEEWLMDVEATMAAMSNAFDSEVNIKQLKDEGRNVMLLSGDLPTLKDWSAKEPSRLANRMKGWQRHRPQLQLVKLLSDLSKQDRLLHDETSSSQFAQGRLSQTSSPKFFDLNPDCLKSLNADV